MLLLNFCGATEFFLHQSCQSQHAFKSKFPLGLNVFSFSADSVLAQSLCAVQSWPRAEDDDDGPAAVHWPLVLIGVAPWPLSCFISLIRSKWPPCWLFTSCAGNHMLQTRSPCAAPDCSGCTGTELQTSHKHGADYSFRGGCEGTRSQHWGLVMQTEV